MVPRLLLQSPDAGIKRLKTQMHLLQSVGVRCADNADCSWPRTLTNYAKTALYVDQDPGPSPAEGIVTMKIGVISARTTLAVTLVSFVNDVRPVMISVGIDTVMTNVDVGVTAVTRVMVIVTSVLSEGAVSIMAVMTEIVVDVICIGPVVTSAAGIMIMTVIVSVMMDVKDQKGKGLDLQVAHLQLAG